MVLGFGGGSGSSPGPGACGCGAGARSDPCRGDCEDGDLLEVQPARGRWAPLGCVTAPSHLPTAAAWEYPREFTPQLYNLLDFPPKRCRK